MNKQLEKLQVWYAGLQQREQRMVAIGGVVVAALILVMGILLPLQSAVSSAVKRNQTEREDLAWMQVNAPEIRAAGSALPADTGEAPVVLVDRVGREAGLASALRGTQPNGTGVRVQLEAAPFDTLISWLATLDERYGFAIESITVDRAPRPGVVNASITFTQSRR
jgi:general secretion pathway protein M